MAVIGNDGRSYATQAAADAANARMAAMGTAPKAPVATTSPAAVPAASPAISPAIPNTGARDASGNLMAGQSNQNPLVTAAATNRAATMAGTNTQAQQQTIRDNAAATAFKISPTINNYGATTPEAIAAQKALNLKYNLPEGTGIWGEGGLAKAPQTPRNLEAEKAITDKYGAPQNAEEQKNYYQQAYSPQALAHNIETGQVSASLFNPDELKQLGLTPDRLQHLVDTGRMSQALLDQMKATGAEGGQAQSVLDATPPPDNAKMNILSEALNAKNNFKNQQLGTSDLFKMAGLSGYSVLAQSMNQRSTEMNAKVQSATSLVTASGQAMATTYKQIADNYTKIREEYDKQLERLTKIDAAAKDHEDAVDMLNKQTELEAQSYEWKKQIDAKYASEKPDLQFVAETDNQNAGFFNKNTGEFTPLSVGGNEYSSGGQSSYLGSATSSNGSSLQFDTPVPHGAANTLVSESNPNLIDIYTNGFKKAAGANGLGGQCAYEAESWVNLNGKSWTVGNTIQQKAASLAKFVKQGLGFYKGQGQPQVGNAVISNDSAKYGHVWVINAITDDGKLVASEFNRAGSRVFSNNRIVDPNDKSILGFLKTEPKSQYQIEKETVAQKNIQKAVDGIKQLATGKKQGGLLDLLTAGTGVLTDVLVDQGKQSQIKQKQLQDQQVQKAKIQEGIKSGILDENGTPLSPDRRMVRSGVLNDTMLNQKYTQLQNDVKKGREPQEALDAFQQDMVYAKQKAAQMAQQTKYDQPLNEAQGKAIGFAVSANQAEGFMPKNGTDVSLAKINDWTRNLKNDDIVSDKMNEIRDPVAKQIVQSEMQWVANVLRGESGAAIALSEYKNAGQTYFPRPGDTPEMLQAKKQARQQKVNNLLVMGGPAGAKYWQNLGYELPSAIAKQYGMEIPQNDSLGLSVSGNTGNDPLGLGF